MFIKMTNIFNKISIKLQLWWSKKVLGWNLNTLDTLQNELIEKSTNITDDILIKNGFEKKYFDQLEYFYYTKYVTLKSKPNVMYKLKIEEGSNTNDREWYMHVDNELSMTCGNLDIQTIYHFNQFLNLLDIDFKLK